VGDTSHTDVIESSAEESTKGRAEGDLNSTGKRERERELKLEIHREMQ